MRRGVRWAASAVCLISAVIFGISGSIMWKKSALTETGITLKAGSSHEIWTDTEGNTHGGITLNQVENIRETEMEKENPVDFTAWSEVNGARVTDGDGLRGADTTVLRICGTSEYLIPYGKILQGEDKEGCLIGEKTAELLFGSHEAEGLAVLYNGRRLLVRGVLREPADVFILQESNESAVFDRITLELSEVSGEAARKFRDSCGLSGMIIINTKESFWDKIFYLVPGKWSDFSGWRVNIESCRNEAAEEGKISKSIFELAAAEQKRTAAFLLTCSGAALILGMAAGKRKM